MKKVLCAVLAAAMLFTMTGCPAGPGSDGPDPTDPNYFSIPATGNYSDNIKLPELDNAHVTVMMSIDWTYLENNYNEADPFAQYDATLIWRDAYAAQAGDVEIITITDEQQTDYVATQTASGTAPDILPANYDLTYPRWNAAGLTASIEEYADFLQLDAKNPNNPEEDLYNHQLMDTYFQWGGESHGAITLDEVDKNYIVYNKTKFEQNGQATPLQLWQDGKWNWTQFVKTCKAMTNGDDFGFTGWGLFPYFAPYQMAVLGEDGTVQLNIDDTKYIRYMTEVYNLYQTENAARRDIMLQQWSTLFPMGTDAMVQTTLAGYKRIVEMATKQEGDEFGIAPVPAFDPTGETVGIPTATLWAYSIASAAENPIGAAAYIRLETLVSRNVAKALDGTTWYDQTLTEEEQEMIEAIKDEPVSVEMIRGIGDCYLGIVDANIVPKMYYEESKSGVQAIFDAQKSALQAEFDEFNEMVEEVALEAQLKAEQAADEGAADATAE